MLQAALCKFYFMFWLWLESLDNCITRLRLEVKDGTLVNEKKIKAAGVAGVMRPSQTAVQVIIGTKVQFVADEMAKMLK